MQLIHMNQHAGKSNIREIFNIPLFFFFPLYLYKIYRVERGTGGIIPQTNQF